MMATFVNCMGRRSGVLIDRNRQLRYVCRSQRLSTNVKAHFKNIGFIGLGNMGRRMAENVLAKDCNLVVYYDKQEALDPLKKEGVTVLHSPQDVAAKVDRVITMLPNTESMLEVYKGENGILKSVKKGCLLIDSSTVDPDAAKEVAELAEAKESVFFDAPVSGDVDAARLAKLTFMVGGPKEELPKAKEILEMMGKNVVHCGPVGSGQAVKICNNMLLGISMIGTSEAIHLGKKMGIDPKVLLDIINSSSGRCWSSEFYCPVPGVTDNVPSSSDYRGGFQTKLMAKDLRLAYDAADRTKTHTPLGSLAYELYSTMVTSGFADKDFSSVYKFFVEDGRIKGKKA